MEGVKSSVTLTLHNNVFQLTFLRDLSVFSPKIHVKTEKDFLNLKVLLESIYILKDVRYDFKS